MMSKNVIEFKNVSKCYPIRRNRISIQDILGSFSKKEIFFALDKISFSIGKGENIGIIGMNGSGKTTILKIIARITQPSSGRIITKGKIVSLINLEAGFHPELSGYENIMVNGLIVGMDKDEVEEKKQSIIDFADIGEFIYQPVYTYSDGMKLRLGFSIVIHSNPDIMLIDEYLAVGDESFLNKSLAKIQEIMDNGATLVMVTHNLKLLKRNSSRVIWFSNGKIAMDGKPKEVIARYLKESSV